MNKNQINLENSNEIKKFDIVFIGGGPSTLSFLSYLFQYNLARIFFSNCKVLILEKSEYFGPGCLGEYGINTNTEAQGFCRLVCDPSSFNSNYKDNQEAVSNSNIINIENTTENKGIKESNTESVNNTNNMTYNNNENDDDLLNQNEFDDPDIKENQSFIPLSFLKEVFDSIPCQTLKSLGIQCAPLPLVGYYLNTVGKFFARYIYQTYNQNIFQGNTKVKKISMLKNNEFILDIDKGNTFGKIQAKNVILSTGGKPKMPINYDFIISNLNSSSCFLLSSDFLKEKGYETLMLNLKTKDQNNKKKIIIVGGSHSGFSSAWILLNKPSNNNYNDIMKYEICNICGEDIKCFCFGKINNYLWNENIYNYDYEYDITILYRDKIRVFYVSESEAYKDNYFNFSKETDLNDKGKIFSFIGLRADAKKLYNDIINGVETRVKLIKTETNEEQLEYFKSCDAIIWACGYQSEEIESLDFRDNIINYCKGKDNLFEVDLRQRLLTNNKMPLKNIFGIGQGYPAFAKETKQGEKTRGDSIHTYNTIISKRLYRALSGFINLQIQCNLLRNKTNGKEMLKGRDTMKK